MLQIIYIDRAGVAAGDGIKAALDALSFLRKIGFSEKITAKLEMNIIFQMINLNL